MRRLVNRIGKFANASRLWGVSELAAVHSSRNLRLHVGLLLMSGHRKGEKRTIARRRLASCGLGASPMFISERNSPRRVKLLRMTALWGGGGAPVTRATGRFGLAGYPRKESFDRDPRYIPLAHHQAPPCSHHPRRMGLSRRNRQQRHRAGSQAQLRQAAARVSQHADPGERPLCRPAGRADGQ